MTAAAQLAPGWLVVRRNDTPSRVNVSGNNWATVIGTGSAFRVAMWPNGPSVGVGDAGARLDGAAAGLLAVGAPPP